MNEITKRLDLFLTEKALAPTRENAKKLIQSGFVTVNGKLASKPSQAVSESDNVAVTETFKYVGRGGYKLEKVIEECKINLDGLVCGDIGASTGGFTDCMLGCGAKRVYAVDVGHDQLAEKLRNDSRVVNLEGVNVKNLDSTLISEKLDFISVDISFISIRHALVPLKTLLSENGRIAFLIKPQFEVGRENVGKGGIVKSPDVHKKMLASMFSFFTENGMKIEWFSFSKIKGGDGNIEYLALLSKGVGGVIPDVFATVNSAFETLK